MENIKYNKKTEYLEPYIIPVSTNNKYKLDMGEWSFPCHNSVLLEIEKFKGVERYNVMDNEYDLLLSLIKTYNDIKSEILLTNGSDNGLRLLLELFATPESNFLVPVPSYVHFECMLNTFIVNSVYKPYIDYRCSNEEYYNKLNEILNNNNYDVCYLVNPSMPVGHLLNEEQLINLVSNYKHTVFIIDEAYLEFTEQKTFSKFVENYKNLIVVKTFSKFFSLASLRIGYTVCSSEVKKLLYPYYNSKDITKLSINCAIKTLENINYYLTIKNELNSIKTYLKIELNKLVNSNKITDYILNEGMYFTIICNDPSYVKLIFEEHSIAVRNKNSDITGATRITIDKKDVMEQVIKILNLL